MFEPSGLRTGYAVFAVAFQIMLVADFIARLVRPELELKWGWIVYVVGIVGGLVLTILLIARGIPTKFVIGPVLLFVWTIFGLLVDSILRIPWRSPPRLALLMPYVTLYTVTLFGFLFPLWEFGPRWGIIYTVFCVAQYALNISSHFRK